MRRKIISNNEANFWNVKDDLKDKNFSEIQSIARTDSLPFAVCALNVTGDMNIGMMIRTASLMGAERFIIYGHIRYDGRTTVGAHNWLDIVKIDARIPDSIELNYDNFFPTMEKYDYNPIFFDTGGISIKNVDMSSICHRPCLIFGNEGVGIPPILYQNRTVITIPQRGVLRSLNVSSAASIGMYHFSSYLS